MRKFPALAATAATATVLVTGLGCATRTQAFEGYPEDRLWSAMVASARNPKYDDWRVMDNQVHAEDGSHGIEVYRVLRRNLVHPESAPSLEQREWKFQIELRHDANAGGLPVVAVTARQIAVPAHVWTEADRYFAQVRAILDAPAQEAAAGTEKPAQ